MTSFSDGQYQNYRVWARRFEQPVRDQERVMCFLTKQGLKDSILTGPVLAVLLQKLEGSDLGRAKAYKVALLAAKTLVAFVRNTNKHSNILAEAAHQDSGNSDPTIFAGHSTVICGLVSKGIALRSSEKSKPNLGNILLGAKRERQVQHWDEDEDPSAYM